MNVSREKIEHLSDDEIIAFYRSHPDNKYVGELYKRYGHLVFGTCLNYVKNKEDAEDIVMDIFVSLGNKLNKYKVTYFKSWLYMLTKNECLSRLRKKKHSLTLTERNTVADENEIYFKKVEEIKLSSLEEAINELSPPQDEAIKLFYIQQLTYKEISDQLTLPLKKVKSAIQNGKRNLKIKLMENDVFKSA